MTDRLATYPVFIIDNEMILMYFIIHQKEIFKNQGGGTKCVKEKKWRL